MLKLVLSIVGGVAVAFSIVLATDALFHSVLASGAAPSNMNDREAMRLYVASQPIGALATMLVGWTLAALAGSWVASRFAGHVQWPGWVVAGLFFLATAFNFFLVPHPVWMVVAGTVSILVAGWLGANIGSRVAVRPVSAR